MKYFSGVALVCGASIAWGAPVVDSAGYRDQFVAVYGTGFGATPGIVAIANAEEAIDAPVVSWTNTKIVAKIEGGKFEPANRICADRRPANRSGRLVNDADVVIETAAGVMSNRLPVTDAVLYHAR